MTRVLVISDLHVGSKYAVAPSDWETHRNNKIQDAILGQWRKMCSQGHYDYVIINGDIVDGVAKKSEGCEVWTADLDEQIEAAVSLVDKIDYDKVLVTYGSVYHTKENLNCDQQFAKLIGAVAHGHELSFQPKGQQDIFHISHAVGVSTSVWHYRTTPVARELVAALLNEKALYQYKGVIRSHAHYYCKVTFSNQFAFVTPSWQARTPYMIRKGLSLIPNMGWVVMDNEVGDGDWRITANCFDMPRPVKVTV